MRYLAVAWDVDGTLIDSEPLHLRALQDVSCDLGADLSDLADDAFLGVSLPDVWTALAPRYPATLDREDWLDLIDARYVAGKGLLRPIADAGGTVRRLAEYGLRQAAVSNSSRRVVDANLSVDGIGLAMEFSISLDDVSAGKPDPTPYRLAAGRFALAPDTVLAVEDSHTGAQSANAAGCAVAFLGAPAPDFADHVLTSLSDLAAILAPGPA